MSKPQNESHVVQIVSWTLDQIKEAESERKRIYSLPGISPGAADSIATVIDAQIQSYRDKILKEIRNGFTLFPGHHARHFARLEDFFEQGSYDESIFVMTKFPDADDADGELEAIIAYVEKCVADCGFIPRVARGRPYHESLWDNVELHLLGCSRGIAIVESKSRRELNPNVAMEWGFMRAMGKPVLYLQEEAFRLHRADWSGLLKYTFSWKDPEPGIEKAVRQWLER